MVSPPKPKKRKVSEKASVAVASTDAAPIVTIDLTDSGVEEASTSTSTSKPSKRSTAKSSKPSKKTSAAAQAAKPTASIRDYFSKQAQDTASRNDTTAAPDSGASSTQATSKSKLAAGIDRSQSTSKVKPTATAAAPLLKPAEKCMQAGLLARNPLTKDCSASVRSVITPATVYKDERLTAIQRVERAFETIRAHDYSTDPDDTVVLANLSDLVTGPVESGGPRWRISVRKMATTARGRTHHAGEVHFQWGSNSDRLVFQMTAPSRKNIPFSVPLSFFAGIDILQPENLRRLADGLETAVRKWPHPTPPTSQEVKKQIMRAAAQNIPGCQFRLTTPSWQAGSGLRLTLYYLNERGESKQLYIATSTGIWLGDKPVPQVPPEVHFTRASQLEGEQHLPKHIVDGVAVWESCVPPYEELIGDPVFTEGNVTPREQLIDHENFYRYAIWRFTGSICSEKELREALAALQNEYLGFSKGTRIVKSRKNPHILAGSLTSSKPPHVGIRFSTHSQILANASERPNLFTLRSYNKVVIGKVFEAADTAATKHSSNVDGVWAGARAAALITDDYHEAISLGNEVIEPCQCSEAAKKQNHHRCSECLSDYLCAKLKEDTDGSKICQSCSKQGFQDDMRIRLKSAIHRNVVKEYKTRFSVLDTAKVDLIVEDACAKVYKQLEGCSSKEYIDFFTGDKTRQPATYSAFRVSIDAVKPFVLRINLVFGHHGDNLATVATWFNLAKSQYLPGCLQCIADYANTAKTESDAQTFVDRMDELHMISLKVPKQRRSQTQELDDTQLALLNYEWVSGRLLGTRQRAKLKQLLRRIVSGKTVRTCQWSDEERQDLINICKEIAMEYGTEALFSTSDDGAPWFSQLGPRPSWWSWDHLFTFCLSRFIRMKLACNRHWLTVDDPLRLACEIFFQLNTTSAEYDSLLKLPMVLWLGHPLCLSIGHKVHGLQMMTGWSEHPKTLRDRDNDRNNIKIMTAIENKAEWNWLISEYPHIIAAWRKVKLSADVYDSGLQPTQGIIDAAEAAGEIVEIKEKPLTSAELDDLDGVLAAVEAKEAASASADLSETSDVARSTTTSLQPTTLVSQAPDQLGFPWTAMSHDMNAAYYTKWLAANPDAVSVQQMAGTAPPYYEESYRFDTLFRQPSMLNVDAVNPYSAPIDPDRKLLSPHWLSDDVLRHALLQIQTPTGDPVWINADISSQEVVTHSDRTSHYDSAYLREIVRKNQEQLDNDEPVDSLSLPERPPAGCRVQHRIWNQNDLHWKHLEMQVDIAEKTGLVIVRDSAEVHDWEDHEDCLQFAMLYSQDRKSPWFGVQWEMSDHPATTQGNNDDCGAFAFESIRRVLAGQPIPDLPSDSDKLAFGARIREDIMLIIYPNITGTDPEVKYQQQLGALRSRRNNSGHPQPVTMAAAVQGLASLSAAFNASASPLTAVQGPIVTPSAAVPTLATPAAPATTASISALGHGPFTTPAVADTALTTPATALLESGARTTPTAATAAVSQKWPDYASWEPSAAHQDVLARLGHLRGQYHAKRHKLIVENGSQAEIERLTRLNQLFVQVFAEVNASEEGI